MESVVYVLHPYQASLAHQLTVQVDDVVIVLNDEDPEWWFAQNLETRNKGFVPADNLEFLNERIARHNRDWNVFMDIVNEQKFYCQGTMHFQAKPLSRKRSVTYKEEVDVYSREFSDPGVPLQPLVK